jgi:methylmalonyl-CoA decarboxylase
MNQTNNTGSNGGAASSMASVEIVGDIGVITLKNQARRNALCHEMMHALSDAFARFVEAKIRVVILRAEPGVKVWSAGHDIGELPSDGLDPLRYADPMEETLRAIRMFPGPVIAMVQGAVWGGAFDLVLSCDLVYADETATFAITPVNLGLPYNTTGLLHFMGRLRLNVVKELFFTASPVAAEVALEWGIINHLVPSTELEADTMAAARQMAAKAPLAMAVIKEQLRVLSDFQPIPAQVFERIQDMRRKVYESADYREGIAAFKEKRPPVFKGD